MTIRIFKLLAPFILLVSLLFMLSGCGESLQKPTGLEDGSDKQADTIQVNDTEKDNQEPSDNKKEETSNKSDNNKDEPDSNKVDTDSESQKSTTSKETNKKENSTKDSEQGSSVENDKTSESKKAGKEKNEPKSEPKKKENNSKPKKDKKSVDNKPDPKPKDKEKKEKNDKSPPKEKQEKKEKKTATISVEIPSDRVILPVTTVEIDEGETVLKVLDQILRENSIQVSIQTGGYVSSIDNVAEKERGSGSGWMYSVNGTFPNIGAGSYKIEDGDVIEWLYTTNLGEDLGAH